MIKYRLMALGMITTGIIALLVLRELSMIFIILMGLGCLTAKEEDLMEV